MRACVIFNPTARGDKARHFREHLGDLAGECEFKPSTSAGAAITLAQAVLPAMRAQRSGRIVLISSRAVLGLPGRTHYSATKAALIGLTRTWALEFAADGITVNAISPGPLATRAASGIHNFNQLLEADADKAPLGRNVTIDEVGALTAFLCTPGSSGMTGQTIYVDAGAHIVA